MRLRSGLATLLVLAAPAFAAGAPQPDPLDVPAGDPLDIVATTLAQTGPALTLTITTARPWALGRLDDHPGRSLCAFLHEGATNERLCLHAGPRLRLTSGALAGGRFVPGTVTRPDQRTVAVTARLSTLRLAVGRLRWRVRSTWRGGRACARTCTDNAPDDGAFTAGVRSAQPIGCTPAGPPLQSFGPARNQVALTFDDGPGPSTPAVLAALEKARVRATFFVVGKDIAGQEALLRREMADGDAIGDHTWSHENLVDHPSDARSQIRETEAAIHAATGFTPCMFRAPYGDTDPQVLDLARSLGMTTIGWNVDPRDWSLPGTGRIVSRVLRAVMPGAIVILHDGGGPRDETAAAIPRIVAGLRARGLRPVTVPDLLGFAPTYVS